MQSPVREINIVRRRCPRVVNDGYDVVLTAHGGNRGHVLQLKTVRTHRFHHHEFGVCADELFNPGADSGFVKLHLHPKAREHVFGKVARGAVDRVGKERMVSGAHKSHQRHCAGRKPR